MLLALFLWEIGHLSSPSRSCLGRLILIRGGGWGGPAGRAPPQLEGKKKKKSKWVRFPREKEWGGNGQKEYIPFITGDLEQKEHLIITCGWKWWMCLYLKSKWEGEKQRKNHSRDWNAAVKTKTQLSQRKKREAYCWQGRFGSAKCHRECAWSYKMLSWMMRCAAKAPSGLEHSLILPAAGKIGCGDAQLSPFPRMTFFRKEQPHPSFSSLARGCPSTITDPHGDIKAQTLASKHSSAGAPSSREPHGNQLRSLLTLHDSWTPLSAGSRCLHSLPGVVSESTPQ